MMKNLRDKEEAALECSLYLSNTTNDLTALVLHNDVFCFKGGLKHVLQ